MTDTKIGISVHPNIGKFCCNLDLLAEIYLPSRFGKLYCLLVISLKSENMIEDIYRSAGVSNSVVWAISDHSGDYRLRASHSPAAEAWTNGSVRESSPLISSSPAWLIPQI